MAACVVAGIVAGAGVVVGTAAVVTAEIPKMTIASANRFNAASW
jgi:acetyltransferase-like isoleucine patch superfamily enzyme